MAQEIVAQNRSQISPESHANLTRKFSRTDAATLLAVMITVYSERKGANVEVLVNQWLDALQHYELRTIEAAWRACRNEETFFPSIATFLKYVRAERPPALPRPAQADDDAPMPFCRDGRTEAEEIAHRAAMCLKMRRQYGLGARDFKIDAEAERVPAPASQEGMTSALKEIAQRAGYWRSEDDQEAAA